MNLKLTALIAGGALLASLPLLTAFQAPAKEAPAKEAPAKISGKTLLAADELKWGPMPGLEGATQAVAWGDPTKGPHRIFYKWPAGTKSPPHTHSHGDRAVILSGTLSLAVEGAAPKKLGPGSFFSLGAGVKHITAVEGDAPCVFFLEREGPFDVVVAEK